MTYAYIRVSTNKQNIDRQYELIKSIGLCEDHIYIDKDSGKNFERSNYKKLIAKLQKNDLLIIKSIDRLGRNYNMIIEEWSNITKKIGADIKVLDMPILNTKIDGQNLIRNFISDIVLQVLSFVAENERNNIRERQAEGIKIAKAKGVKFGRPALIVPSNAIEIVNMYKNKVLTNVEAAKLIGVSKGTFYKIVKSFTS